MKVVVVSGVWPPDVGGPATHAPELCDFLLGRGHCVEAVTTASVAPERQAYAIHWTSRRLPIGVRHAVAAMRIERAANGADVVYSTGMLGRSSAGAAAARVPVVAKLTSDPVFERSLRWRLFSGDLASLQRAHGRRIALLRRVRDLELARAVRVVVPSEALRVLALAWGVPAEKVTVIRNPVAVPRDLEEREALRVRHGMAGPTLVYAGRLAPQKSVDTALAAVSRVDGVSLVVAGDGAERDRLRRQAARLGLDGRIRFLGALPRHEVFELLRAADASILTSTWENFPHVVVESLAVGTPVLATDVGGVREAVRDDENGLLVPARDAAALADAIRRFVGDPDLQARLRGNATASLGGGLELENVYGELEEVLVSAALLR
jgi:glycosyltransferase involved in cell wall biosynthesis